ncbi:hypothetical protein QMM42_10265 [Leptospira santarosai]|uniref:hypothetical protein n=1 Tax=Leptospira santarosai TaxID=28183 RepID=UPI0002BD7468|nr:hypothetical protein [Leptospira santarosai]EMJ46393.1 hypothetical protein LEP1GSC169_3119 [Leptospira santarosai str. HAI1349]EMM84730.1 hypothetical protein LEP1GSC039_2960 [Leptospira santarosai str. 2000027870]MDI7181174.1 hypothetical protein [Leptospira santarosai]MDI7186583.1 hypothetical protein [Leptospira santarosai]MDI7188978.1 hypothetical protein [Leptospira santarosai]
MFKQLTVILILILTNCTNHSNIDFYVDSFQKPFISDFFNKSKISFSDRAGILSIEKNHYNESRIENLIMVQLKRIELCVENIRNIQTSKSSSGSFYKKKSLFLNTDGLYVTSEDSKSRLVFDPGHPDAIRRGPKKGYVQFPNITLEEELFELKSHILLYNSLVLFLKKEKNIVIHEENFDNYISVLSLAYKKRHDEIILQLETVKLKLIE